MIITCKCGEHLTNDLRPVRGFLLKPFGDAIYDCSRGKGGGNFEGARISSGGFLVKPKIKVYRKNKQAKFNRVHHSPASIYIGGSDILKGVIPLFKQGYGCCNWSMGEDLHCTCGRVIGKMHLDCYEYKVVQFLEKEVVRYYGFSYGGKK